MSRSIALFPTVKYNYVLYSLNIIQNRNSTEKKGFKKNHMLPLLTGPTATESQVSQCPCPSCHPLLWSDPSCHAVLWSDPSCHPLLSPDSSCCHPYPSCHAVLWPDPSCQVSRLDFLSCHAFGLIKTTLKLKIWI